MATMAAVAVMKVPARPGGAARGTPPTPQAGKVVGAIGMRMLQGFLVLLLALAACEVQKPAYDTQAHRELHQKVAHRE